MSQESKRIGFLALQNGPISCPEMLVRNYHYTLLSIPEEPRSRKISVFAVWQKINI